MTQFEELTRELIALSPDDFQHVKTLGERALGQVVLPMYIPEKMLEVNLKALHLGMETAL